MGEGEDGVQFEAVIESCSGWRLNKLPEVKNFIYGDFESKFERTVFKKIPGKAPEAIFYDAKNKVVEKLNIEKFSRSELNQLMIKKGIPQKPDGNGRDEV